MKNLFKVKEGGRLGREKKHRMKIKSFGFALVAIMAVLFATSAYGLDVETLTQSVVSTGIAIAAFVPVVYMKEEGKFTELKGEDLKAFVEKAAPEEIAEYYKHLFEYKNKLVNDAIDKKADISEINKLKEEQTTIKNELIDALATLKSLKEKGVPSNLLPTMKEVLIKHKDNLMKLKNGDSTAAFKAVGNMTIAGNVTGEVPQSQRLTGLNDIASRAVRFLDFLQTAVASSNLITWAYKSGREGTTGATAEAAAKNQIDFNILVGSQKVEKITNFIKVSTEMLDDIDFIESEINNELRNELLRAVELGSYSGSGVSPILNGVRTVATAFAAGTFALAIDNANQVDVLVVAANQIAIAEHEAPNVIFMHPTDITKLKVVKLSATDKRYVERLAMIGGSLSMDGIPIVGTTLVTVGEYLIGNFNKAFLFQKSGGVQIDMGLDGNDFTTNMVTIRAEWRGAVVVKNNDRTAFVKGVFATDMAALETA